MPSWRERTKKLLIWWSFYWTFCCFFFPSKKIHKTKQNIKRFEFYWTFAFVSSRKISFVFVSNSSTMDCSRNEKHKFIFTANAKFLLWSFSQFKRTKKYAQIFGSFLSDFWLRTLRKWNHFDFYNKFLQLFSHLQPDNFKNVW